MGKIIISTADYTIAPYVSSRINQALYISLDLPINNCVSYHTILWSAIWIY